MSNDPGSHMLPVTMTMQEVVVAIVELEAYGAVVEASLKHVGAESALRKYNETNVSVTLLTNHCIHTLATRYQGDLLPAIKEFERLRKEAYQAKKDMI